MTFGSVNGIFPTGISINTNEVYDLRGRHENDEIYDGASTASMEGATILSSAPNSNSNRVANDGNNNINIQLADDIALSLSPSMVNSSILIPGSSSTIGSSLSDDMISLISSCDSAVSSNTTTRQPDDALSNVGRSLALASIDDDATFCSDKESVMIGVVDWWDRLKTDDDWNNFRIKANEYLNVLIAEEMKIRTQHCTGTEYNVDKTSTIEESVPEQQHPNDQHQGLLQWLHGLYESINKTISGITSRDESAKTKLFNSLMKEIVDLQQQLDQLPPLPPSLPEELSLDDMPSESRDMLIEYRENLDEWKGNVMPQRDELFAKYVKCQEKLLSRIIDTEEQAFYHKNSSFGSMNDDGYVEVIEKTSPQWDSVNDVLVMRSRFNATTLFLAAISFGAGLFITLRSKRS